jgi:hypothetical protein
MSKKQCPVASKAELEEKIDLNKLHDGQIALQATRPPGKIDGFLGLLVGKAQKIATLDEINEGAVAGWAGTE